MKNLLLVLLLLPVFVQAQIKVISENYVVYRAYQLRYSELKGNTWNPNGWYDVNIVIRMNAMKIEILKEDGLELKINTAPTVEHDFEKYCKVTLFKCSDYNGVPHLVKLIEPLNPKEPKVIDIRVGKSRMEFRIPNTTD